MCLYLGCFVCFVYAAWFAPHILSVGYSVKKANKATQTKANTTNKPTTTHKTICVYSTVYPSPSEGQQ